MTYAENRIIIDADSHVIELDDFLHKVALENDLPSFLQWNHRKSFRLFKQVSTEVENYSSKRQQDPQVMAKFE